MATEADNQEPTTETILHNTPSESEPGKHHETVLKHFEAENVKDHIEDGNIDELNSVGKASSEKLLSSSSELNTTAEICDSEVSEKLDGTEIEDQVSRSLGVKETEGQLPKSSAEGTIDSHHVEKGQQNSLEEIQIISKETVGEGYREHNGGTAQEAEVYGSEVTDENKAENLSNTSITLDDTEKITSAEPLTFDDHIRQPPQPFHNHTISSGTAEMELHMASASEDVHSNLEEMEHRGDMEEISNNEKIVSDAPQNVTLQSNYLSEPNKDEGEKGDETNAFEGRALGVLPTEAIESSSDVIEMASLDGQIEKVEKTRNIEINLPESPREARKDQKIDASTEEESSPFDEKNVTAADLNEEDETHLHDTAKGQQNAPPLVPETEAPDKTQLSVEEPKVMHDIDEADRKLHSSEIGLPQTEGASDMDLAPPCQTDADNLQTESNMNSKKESESIETKTEDEEQNVDSHIESHNLDIANDDNSKVNKEEEEFDSSRITLSDEKIDEPVHESEHMQYQQTEGKSEATGLRDGKESDVNDNMNQNSKPEEHEETVRLDEAEEIVSHITDKEHTTQSYSETLTSEELQIVHNTSSESQPSKHHEPVLKHYEVENVKHHVEADSIDKLTSVGRASSSELDTTVEICDTTEVSEKLDGTETEDQVSRSLGVKETEGQLPRSSEEGMIEGHHVEKGEQNSLEEIQIISKETVGEGYREHNGGTAQEAEVYGSEVTDENKAENLSNTSITLEGTEKITSVEPLTFEDHIRQTPPHEEPCHTISSDLAEKELQIASASEDVHSNLPESPREAEAVESSSGIKEMASVDGQSEEVENERIIENNLPESPREARKDETIDGSSIKEKLPFDEKLYDTDKGQQNAPSIVHETEASEGTQLSVEEPKVMHDTDGADRKIDSDLGLPLTEGASDMDLAPPCQIDPDNLETKLTMNSVKELEIIETNTANEDQNGDSLVESHNISNTNDANSKVTKDEIEFDSSSTTVSAEKIDELDVQESEHRKDPQMEGESEGTGMRDGKVRDINDNTNQYSKPEEYGETDTLDKEAEEIYSDITNKEHTTQIYSATVTTEESQVFHKPTSITEPDEKLYEAENVKSSNIESSEHTNIDESFSVGPALSEKLLSSSSDLNEATETDNGTEQISESLEGNEIQGQVSSDRKETDSHASVGTEGQETESWDRMSSDGKEMHDHHVEQGEQKSTQEIQTITEEILGEVYKGPNGGVEPEGTDIDIPPANSHQNEEVEVSELTGENHVDDMTEAIKLDNTEKIPGVEPVAFGDHLYRSSAEGNSSEAISSSMAKKELYVPSAPEDPLANLEDTELSTMKEEIMNHEKMGHSDPVNVTIEPDHLSNTIKEDREKGEEMNSHLGSALNVTPIEDTCITSSSEADVSSSGVKDLALLDEQPESEEKAKDTEINLPEVPTETREDENIDANSAKENQPFHEKNTSAADLKEEDGTNQHDPTKSHLDAPLLLETEVCEDYLVSAEEPEGTHGVLEEADRMTGSNNLGLTPIEGGSDMDMIHPYQTDADNAETRIDSPKELLINAESNTKDKLQEHDDADIESIKAETNFDSSSTIPTAKITDELNIHEREYREDSHMAQTSEAKGNLGDGKESVPINDNNQNSESQGHGGTDTFKGDEEIQNITDQEQSIQNEPGTLTTEEVKKTTEEAVKECKDEGTEDEDEASASIRENNLLDSLATPEEVIKASIEEDEENGSQIKEEHYDQAIEFEEKFEHEAKIDDFKGEDKEGKEENVVVSQVCAASTSVEPETIELGSLNNLLPTSVVEKVEESQEIIEENADSTKPEEIMILEKENDEQNLDVEHQVEDTKSEALNIKEKSTADSSMLSPTGIVENEMPIQEHKSIEEKPSSLPDEPESQEESSVSQSVAATTKGLENDDNKENEMHDRDEELDSLILKESASESTGSKPDEVPEEIEKNDHITQTAEETKEEGTFTEVHSVSEPDIPSHYVKDVAGERHVPLPENPQTEEEPSILEAAEGLKEDKEQVQDMKNMSLHNIEEKDSDEKIEEIAIQLKENSNTEKESSTTEAAQQTTGEKEHVEDMSSMPLQNMDTMDLDEKSEVRVLQLVDNPNIEQEPSATEVSKETTEDKDNIHDMSNMTFGKLEETSSHNFTEEADELVKKESSLKEVHIDEKTVHVYGTAMDAENSSRTNNSSKKDEQAEISQAEQTSGSVYETEPSETKEMVSEMMEKPNQNEVSTETESMYSVNAVSESIEIPKEQEDIADKSKQNWEGKEEIYGMIHENNDDVEVGQITSIQKKEEEATNELQETCVVQPMEEQGHDTLDSIKGTIHDNGIALGVSSVISSEEECLPDNNSNTPELREPLVGGVHDRSTMEEENIYKEKSEETGEEISSSDHNRLTPDNSMKDLDNETGIIEELQEYKEDPDLKSGMSSETKVHHAEVPSETEKGAIKEESLRAEVENIPYVEMTETESTEDSISKEKIQEEASSDNKIDSIPEEPPSITINEISETTKKENNNEKVPDCDIDIILSEKDRRDDEYEKSLKSNSLGEEKLIDDDLPVTDIPDSKEVGETTTLLADGHAPAIGSSLETSEEIKYEDTNEIFEDQVTPAVLSSLETSEEIKYEDTNEKFEDQVTFEANTSDLKVNEATEQHSTQDGDHSNTQDPCLEKLKEDCIDTKEVEIIDKTLPPILKESITNVMRDIEMMPESVNTAAQTETQIQQTTDNSNDVPEATNSDNELECTSDKSNTVEQEATTTIRSVNDPTLDLTEGPRDNDFYPAEKGESLAQLSEVHDDHLITEEAEKEDGIEERDPGETKPMISCNNEDMPLLKSVSSTVTDIEEIKQVYPCEAVPEPSSTGIAEKEASHDQENTADRPERASDLRHGFADENISVPGNMDSQNEHANHVVQHVQETSMGSQEGSIDDLENTRKSAELALATVPEPESVSNPDDSKDDAVMHEKIEAVDARETLECAESSFEEIKGEGNRTTDDPEVKTEEFLPAEISGESTREMTDHPGEKSKLKTQPEAREENLEDAKVEKEEHTEQIEGNLGSGVIFNGKKGPDDNTNKIIEAEVDMSSPTYSNELTYVQVDPEECTDNLINRKGTEQKTDEAKAEREEQEVLKEEKAVSEAKLMSEKDVDDHTIDRSIVAETKDDTSRAMPDDTILVQGSPEIEKKIYIEDDQDEAVKEEQEVIKGGNKGAEILGDKEAKADSAEFKTEDRDVQEKEKIDSEVAVSGEKDCEDNNVSVEENTEDLKEAVTLREDEGVNLDSKSGVTDAEIEEAVAQSERLESTEEKMSSHGYQEKHKALQSTLSSKILQTNQGQDSTEESAEETKLNAAKIEFPTPESRDAIPHISGLSTESIVKADDSDVDISLKNQEKQEIPPLEPEKYMVVEADLKVTEEPENAKNILQLQQKEDVDIFQVDEKRSAHAEQDSTPPNSYTEKTTTNESREGNNSPSEKETPVVEHLRMDHFSEAKKEEEHAKTTGRKEDIKAVKTLEDTEVKNEEGKEHHEENTGSDLHVRIEASRDAEVKVSPKKSHNLFSGVIKNSISKMKKAITCTNSHPMPESPR